MVWTLMQIVVNIVLGLGVLVLWLRLKRPPKDDPRLSRGLQLLQSKISVLEDLSDRTDVQVKQLTTLLDQKARQLQNKVHEGERQIQKIDQAMERSMEVAEIFQDKIPHKEIIERQNTINYVRAARMAHEGYSVEEIAKKVDLPMEQLEFITKVNRDRLMFDSEMLPAWAKHELEKPAEEFDLESQDLLEFSDSNYDFEESEDVAEESIEFAEPVEEKTDSISPFLSFEQAPRDYQSLKRLGDEFRQACESFEKEHEPVPEKPKRERKRLDLDMDFNQSPLVNMAKNVTHRIMDSAGDFLNDQKVENIEEGDSLSHMEISTSDESFLLEKPPVAAAAKDADSSNALTQTPVMESAKLDKTSIEGNKAALATANALRAAAQKASSLTKAATGLATKRGQGKQAFIPSTHIGAKEIKKVEFPRIDINDNLR